MKSEVTRYIKCALCCHIGPCANIVALFNTILLSPHLLCDTLPYVLGGNHNPIMSKQMIPLLLFILTCTHAISSKDHPNMREKKFPLLFDLIHTYHLMEGSLNMHGKSFPLYYATYIPKIFFNPIMKYNI